MRGPPKQKITEVELAKDVIAYLVQDGWEVYQEVKVNGPVADIVAKRGSVIWVIETKTAFGLDVIEQAVRWVGHAHMVSVAVPWTKDSNFKEMICKKFGVGVLFRKTRNLGYDELAVDEMVHPEFNRKIYNKWNSILKDEHKTYCEAGATASHKRFTPFQDTRLQLVKVVTKNPGISMSDALKKIKHHYSSDSSAKSCLVGYIFKNVITEIRMEREGKEIHLFPAS